MRRLAKLERLPVPEARWEQVVSPPEAAAELLGTALARGDLEGRGVIDLGCGSGTLAIGAALLGASAVRGYDIDPASLEVARRNAEHARVQVEFDRARPSAVEVAADTVVMNPPFGAQHRHADRPFFDAAFRLARGAVYAFALRSSRTFIARRAVAAPARIEETRPIPWTLPRTFPHHRKERVALDVDLWVLRLERNP